MKRKTLPTPAQPGYAHTSVPRTPDPQGPDPHVQMPSTGPDYQDMADQSQVVQAAGLLQQAADAMSAPDVDGPVVQGWFIWNGTKINAANIGDHKDNFMRLLGNADINRPGRRGEEARSVRDRRWKALRLAAARDGDSGEAKNKQSLIQVANNYFQQFPEQFVDAPASAAVAAPAARAQAPAVDDAAEEVDDTESVASDDDGLAEWHQLLQENMAFPEENITKLMAESGAGFVKERQLIEDFVRAYPFPEAQVQCGVLRGIQPEKMLKFKPATPMKVPVGHVGADVVVWFPAENGDAKTMFIQSKDTIEGNMKKHAEAAANQLAGINAKGKTGANNSAVKEVTYNGRGFDGVVYICIPLYSDISKLDAAAAAAFNKQPAFVTRVVIEVTTAGEFYSYGKGEKYVLTKGRNPLLGAGVRKPLGPDEKEQLPPPAAKAPVKPAVEEADDDRLKMDTNVAISRSLLPQPMPNAQPHPYQEIKVKDPKVALSAAVNVSEEADASEHEDDDEDEAQVEVTPAAAAASASATPAAKPAAAKPVKKKGKGAKPKRATKSMKKKAAKRKAAQQQSQSAASKPDDGDGEDDGAAT